MSFFWYQDIIDTGAGPATVGVVAIAGGVWAIVGTVLIHARVGPWVPFLAAHALLVAGVLSVGNLGMVLAFSSATSILLIGWSWSEYDVIATRWCTRCGLEVLGGLATCPDCSSPGVKSADQLGHQMEDAGDAAPRLYHVFRPAPGGIEVETAPPELPKGALVNAAGCLMMISGTLGLMAVPLVARDFPSDYGFEMGHLLSASVVGIVGGLHVLRRRLYWFGLVSAFPLLPVAYVDYFLATQGLMVYWAWTPYVYWSVGSMAPLAVLYLLLSQNELQGGSTD
jgi:hypothetical protein